MRVLHSQQNMTHWNSAFIPCKKKYRFHTIVCLRSRTIKTLLRFLRNVGQTWAATISDALFSTMADQDCTYCWRHCRTDKGCYIFLSSMILVAFFKRCRKKENSGRQRDSNPWSLYVSAAVHLHFICIPAVQINFNSQNKLINKWTTEWCIPFMDNHR